MGNLQAVNFCFSIPKDERNETNLLAINVSPPYCTHQSTRQQSSYFNSPAITLSPLYYTHSGAGDSLKCHHAQQLIPINK